MLVTAPVPLPPPPPSVDSKSAAAPVPQPPSPQRPRSAGMSIAAQLPVAPAPPTVPPPASPPVQQQQSSSWSVRRDEPTRLSPPSAEFRALQAQRQRLEQMLYGINAAVAAPAVATVEALAAVPWPRLMEVSAAERARRVEWLQRYDQAMQQRAPAQ
jgi:hypothetical protein